jgi:hypothetical protein
LDASKSGIEFLLELLQAAIGGVDCLGQFAGGWFAAAGVLGSQVLPEKGVIDVPAAMEVDSCLEGNLGGNVIARFGGSILIGCGIVAIDVGLMVLAVVQLHDLARDGWLEGTVVVWSTNKSAVTTHVRRGRYHVQVRSGRVAFIRTNVLSAVVKHRAGLVAATARRVEGRATERNRDAMLTMSELDNRKETQLARK